jgi:L-iditol 2-dehydrogenase
MPMDLVFSKQLTLAGSVCYTERTWDRMMQILAAGRLKLGDLISTKLPISEWQNAFELCQSRQALKVLMYPID